MTNAGPNLSAAQLRSILEELSEELRVRGTTAQLFVVGGAAMALAYDADRLTKDVDALFEPAAEIRELSALIGARHGLDPDWLNDAAKGFLPGDETAPVTVFESEHLLVRAPSPRYLLAMKLFAGRAERDLDDAALLFPLAGLSTAEDAVQLLESSYPPRMLLPRHRYVADEVAQRAAQTPRRDVAGIREPGPRAHPPPGPDV